MGGSPEQVDLPAEEAQVLAAMAKASGYENMLRLLSLLLTSEPIVRRSDSGALAVEIAWLRGAELPKLTRVEEILAGGGAMSAAPASRPPAAAPPQRSRAPEPAPAPPPPRPAPPVVSAAVPAAAPSRPSDPIAAFKEETGKRKPNVGGLLGAAEEIRFEEGRVLILCPHGDNYLKSRLEANRPTLEEAAAAVWGPGTLLDILESRTAPKPAVTEAKPAQVQEVEQIPAVQAVLEIFKGRIETVEEQHGSYTED
jgi:hypothetical protein